MKIILWNFKAKMGGENIFKPAIGNDSLHQDNKDNGDRKVNFAAVKNGIVKGTVFSH
jgi:hypothetical protein